jgi:hypothetical protein
MLGQSGDCEKVVEGIGKIRYDLRGKRDEVDEICHNIKGIEESCTYTETHIYRTVERGYCTRRHRHM